MILEKSKCEKEFLERLINDTDEVYRLSHFYKRMAYIANIKDEDIVAMFEKQISKQVSKDAKIIRQDIFKQSI